MHCIHRRVILPKILIYIQESIGCVIVFFFTSFVLFCVQVSLKDHIIFAFMGLFKDQGVVYKPVEEVDLGPKSDHVYLRANVKGSILGPNSCFTIFFIFSMHVSSSVKELLPLVGILYIIWCHRLSFEFHLVFYSNSPKIHFVN